MKSLISEISLLDHKFIGIKSILKNTETNKHLSYKSNKHNNINSLLSHLSDLNSQLIPDIIYNYSIEIYLSNILKINGQETKVITIKKNIKKNLAD